MTTTVVLGPVEAPAVDFESAREIGYYQLVWRRFYARRIALVSIGVLVLLALACAVGPYLMGWIGDARNEPSLGGAVDPANAMAAPFSGSHVLGTDEIGRDLLLRNLSGGRISLAVGGFSMLLTIGLATIFGALSGFLGGIVDTVTTALVNAILAIPSILILIVFAKAFGQSVQTIVIGISVLSWPYTARIVRSVVLSVREKEFIEAARALGGSRMRILTRHLIPNALGPIVVSASLTIGQAILLESALSFLGQGIGQPTATWGSLLHDGYQVLSHPNGFFFALWPGLLILVTVLSFNYIGDALRDAFDPRALER